MAPVQSGSTTWRRPVAASANVRAAREYADPAYLETEEGRHELEQHLTGRLDTLRRTVVPWLSSIRLFDGARILEVGCGTGCSVMALAEQGARVTGVDIVERCLRVARERGDVYGLDTRLRCLGGTEVHSLFAGERFDLIIFFATLEHLVHDERIAAMRSTWEMLPSGGLWCVVATPNRLWHTHPEPVILPFDPGPSDDLVLGHFRFRTWPAAWLRTSANSGSCSGCWTVFGAAAAMSDSSPVSGRACTARSSRSR